MEGWEGGGKGEEGRQEGSKGSEKAFVSGALIVFFQAAECILNLLLCVFANVEREGAELSWSGILRPHLKSLTPFTNN